jgi:hypothetical protein
MEEQKRRGRPPKQPIDNPRHKPMVCVRDPVVENRDPVIEQPQKRPYNFRRCIQASMPTVCPSCGHNTRQADGRHVDPVRARIVEYRSCIKCGMKLGAIRNMTEREKELLCGGSEIIKDYEAINNS